MVEFLNKKFGDQLHPKYEIQLLQPADLGELRTSDRYLNYKTIDGSARFQVAVFKPGLKSFRAAPYLCLCEHCKNDYGSCDLFFDVEPTVAQLSEKSLRSQMNNDEAIEQEDDTIMDFAPIDSLCAIPADEKTSRTVEFIKITDQCTNDSLTDITDDWGSQLKVVNTTWKVII